MARHRKVAAFLQPRVKSLRFSAFSSRYRNVSTFTTSFSRTSGSPAFDSAAYRSSRSKNPAQPRRRWEQESRS